MDPTSNTFLATRILHEKQPITYRLLARELRIHATAAKRHLNAFHDSARTRFPGAVHATFMLCGRKHSQSPDMMQLDDVSSPSNTLPDSSQQSIMAAEQTEENVPMTVFELVQEDTLELAKLEFESIDVAFVYSLEPGVLPADMITLADCGRKVRDMDYNEDLHELGLFGVIENLAVKRVAHQIRTAPAPKAAPKTAPVAAAPSKSSTKRASAISKPLPEKTTPAPPEAASKPVDLPNESTTAPFSTARSSPFSFVPKKPKSEKPKLEDLKPEPKPEMKAETKSPSAKATKSATPPTQIKPKPRANAIPEELKNMFDSDEGEGEDDDDDDDKGEATDLDEAHEIVDFPSAFIDSHLQLSSEPMEVDASPPKSVDMAEVEAEVTRAFVPRAEKKVETVQSAPDDSGFRSVSYVDKWEHNEAAEERDRVERAARRQQSTKEEKTREAREERAAKEKANVEKAAKEKAKEDKTEKSDGEAPTKTKPKPKPKSSSAGQSSLMNFWKK
ncbi:DNA polymerase subunit Cdc27 [Limtongia smithiae]|uniref:DNA polymerase subunit Cdc27 n=1 Tax=Limtongia smithiae TaxID=1125753 RepID=UPI0034CF6193